MLNVTHHQGNANQNHSDVQLHTHEDGHFQKPNQTKPKQNTMSGDFPGGAVVKNLSANAGDMGSSPRPGRSNMLWSN